MITPYKKWIEQQISQIKMKRTEWKAQVKKEMKQQKAYGWVDIDKGNHFGYIFVHGDSKYGIDSNERSDSKKQIQLCDCHSMTLWGCLRCCCWNILTMKKKTVLKKNGTLSIRLLDLIHCIQTKQTFIIILQYHMHVWCDVNVLCCVCGSNARASSLIQYPFDKPVFWIYSSWCESDVRCVCVWMYGACSCINEVVGFWNI